MHGGCFCSSRVRLLLGLVCAAVWSVLPLARAACDGEVEPARQAARARSGASGGRQARGETVRRARAGSTGAFVGGSRRVRARRQAYRVVARVLADRRPARVAASDSAGVRRRAAKPTTHARRDGAQSHALRCGVDRSAGTRGGLCRTREGAPPRERDLTPSKRGSAPCKT